MPTTLFVPLNDDLPEQHPGFRQDRLVPYQTDLPCYRWLAPGAVAPEVKHDPQEVRHDVAR